MRSTRLLTTVALLGIALTAGAGQKLQIITFDAPGAAYGTGCFIATDCSTIINNSGAITGYYLDMTFGLHGFVRSPEGKFTSFDPPGSILTAPNAINDDGAITGLYLDMNGVEHGFLRSRQGTFTAIDVPDSTPGTTSAIALNAEGAVVGYFENGNGVFWSYLRKPDGNFATWTGPGACETPPADGCFGSGAFGINASGTVSSTYADASFVGHGLVRSPGGNLTTYDAPGAGTSASQGTTCPGCSIPLNQPGALAGYYIDTNYMVHGYLRSPGGEITTFDVPGENPTYGIGCYSDCSLGLNNSGAIAGTYLDANFVFHGFLRSPDGTFTTVDVPAADTTPGSFHGTFAVSINDQGAISGYYLDATGTSHGFVALPNEGH